MTTDELRIEYAKQKERENFSRAVKEYLRVKKMVLEVGDLTHEEAIEIALLLCRATGAFDDIVPGRISRGVGL